MTAIKTIRRAVMRSMPSHERPRLSPSLERRFAPGEARSAAVYADIEAICRRADELAGVLNGVVSGEIECTPSLAHNIDAATRAARLETEPPDE